MDVIFYCKYLRAIVPLYIYSQQIQFGLIMYLLVYITIFCLFFNSLNHIRVCWINILSFVITLITHNFNVHKCTFSILNVTLILISHYFRCNFYIFKCINFSYILHILYFWFIQFHFVRIVSDECIGIQVNALDMSMISNACMW